MAEDTMFRNSVFQAQQAAEGRRYAYEGMTRALPEGLAMARGVQGMGLEQQRMQQRALMDQAAVEADLQKLQILQDSYRSEHEIRQFSAQTRAMELQNQMFEADVRARLDMERETRLAEEGRYRTAAQGPILIDGRYQTLNPETGRWSDLPEDMAEELRQEPALRNDRLRAQAEESRAMATRPRGSQAEMFDVNSLSRALEQVNSMLDGDDGESLPEATRSQLSDIRTALLGQIGGAVGAGGQEAAPASPAQTRGTEVMLQSFLRQFGDEEEQRAAWDAVEIMYRDYREPMQMLTQDLSDPSKRERIRALVARMIGGR